MKSIRLALVTAALLVGSTAVVHAQGGGGGGGGQPGRGNMMARQMERLLTGITVTDAQKAKMDSIQTAYQGQMPQMQPGTQMSDEDRQKMRDLRTKQMADLRGVLTEDQQKVWDKNMEEMRANQGRGGRPGGAPPSGGTPPQA